MINKKNVLVTVPKLSLSGGVTELFNSIKINEIKGIEYFNINYGPQKIGFIFLPFIYLKFIFKLRRIQVVHVNPSLDFKSFFRDLVFVFFSKKMFNKKTIIYWHGWEIIFFKKIENSKFLKFLFLKTYGQANINIVLASRFKNDLIKLGFKKEILLETGISREYSVNINEQIINHDNQFVLLFVSRFVKYKGWDIAIETMKILNKKGYTHIILKFIGDGKYFNHAKDLALSYQLPNVLFLGYCSEKIKCFNLKNSNVLFFPTYYDEGMPMCILEGMMNGLPIISRDVGGIPDNVIHGKNGFITESKNPKTFANYIIELYENQELYKAMRLNNILHAQENFIPERLIRNLLKLYN